MPAIPLTPAEAFVLLDLARASPTEAFKVAFLSLVGLRVLKIGMGERRGLLRTRRVPLVWVVRDAPEVFLAQDIVAVVRLAETAADGVTFKEVAGVAARTFGQGLSKLKTGLILPSLTGQGLLTAEPTHLLWVFKRTNHAYTAAGLVEKQRIEAVLASVRRLPALLATDPAEAKAIALAAGGLLLLVPELKAHYRALAALDIATVSGGDGGDFSSFADGDVTSFCGDHIASMDFSAFDAADFGSFDAGFDASFSDGGGDGGGHGGH